MLSALVAFGVFVAALVSGATGIAFPLVAGPVLLIEHTPVQTVTIVAIFSLLSQIVSAFFLRGSVHYEWRWRLIGAGLIGVPLGTQLLLWIDPHIFRELFGFVLIVAGIWCLMSARVTSDADGVISELAAGISGGLCGGVVGISSAFPAIWLALSRIDKHRHRAIMQPYIVAAQSASVVLLSWRGACTREVGQAVILYVAPVFFGAWLGAVAFHRIPGAAYPSVISGLMLISGVVLLVR